MGGSLAGQFVQLFGQALPGADVAQLFNERLSGYGAMARKGEEFEHYQFHLGQLIKRTADGQLPAHYDFESSPVVLDGIFSDIFLKLELTSFERAMVPAFLKSLENYFNYLERNS